MLAQLKNPDCSNLQSSVLYTDCSIRDYPFILTHACNMLFIMLAFSIIDGGLNDFICLPIIFSYCVYNVYS